MALTSYTTLKNEMESYLNRTDLTANLDTFIDLAEFDETFKDDKTGHVRQNKHKLYIETQKHILSIAKNLGFILQGKIDMVTTQYQYQYIYLLYKPQ